jgi:hypothetical protein
MQTVRQNAQERLNEMGVLDMKFLFSQDANAELISALKDDVEDVLTKYLDKQFTIVENFTEQLN